MATLQNIGKLKYRGKDGLWHPLPVVVQDTGGGVSTISGKGAPTSETQGKVNQLYRDEDTQKLYICTATEGGYTWAEVSVGVSPDWNQNDETAADYVKNRPGGYYGDPVETVLVEESTVTFTGDGGGNAYIGEIPSTFVATVGDTYKVSWDGTVYGCTCVDNGNGIPVIGNLSIIGVGSDTGEPFLISAPGNGGIIMLTADTSASHTFSISGIGAPEVVKIDKKYLVQPDWNQNDETAADYVKNRPFYTEGSVGAALLNSISISCSNGYYKSNNLTKNFEEGASYVVTWDDTEYECVAYYAAGPNVPAIGNGSLASSSGGSNEPFFIMVQNSYLWIFDDTRSTHTVSISTVSDIVHEIDKKYIPKDAFIGITGTGINSEIFNDSSSNIASGENSHAEGEHATANGNNSHAEGSYATADGNNSHAEGGSTTASGASSHAEGSYTTASSESSHAEGCGTIADAKYQHVQGKYNKHYNNGNDAFIVGNGTSNEKRSNACTLDWYGNAWFAGDVYVGSTSGTNKDSGSVKLLKENSDIPVRSVIVNSSTSGSTKKFKITVDDSGMISATEVTE